MHRPAPRTTTALVELYTSEGCDSCPPADRWLSTLGAKSYAPDRVMPNVRPANARISLLLEARQKGAFEVEVEAVAELESALPRADMALYLGAYEKKLVSEVKAGENRGRTLPHDYVFLHWAGPFEFQGLRLVARQTLPLLPKAVPGHSGVVAFVQNGPLLRSSRG